MTSQYELNKNLELGSLAGWHSIYLTYCKSEAFFQKRMAGLIQSELFISFAVACRSHGTDFTGQRTSRYAEIKHGSTMLESQHHTILSRSPYLMLITNTEL
jgi:hypothetical protein